MVGLLSWGRGYRTVSSDVSSWWIHSDSTAPSSSSNHPPPLWKSHTKHLVSIYHFVVPVFLFLNHLNTEHSPAVTVYLMCNPELVSHSLCQMCRSGKRTCILCQRELVWRCWGREHTCRCQTPLDTAAGPSSGASSLWQHRGSHGPD